MTVTTLVLLVLAALAIATLIGLWLQPTYRTIAIRRNSGVLSITIEVSRRFRSPIMETWLSSGGGWIRDPDGLECCANWGGGEQPAYFLNDVSRRTEAKAEIRRKLALFDEEGKS